MKENIQQSYTSEIKWPEPGRVEVGTEVDFVYIIRKDGNFTMGPIAENFSSDYGVDVEVVQQVLLDEYDVFTAKLVDSFKWGYSAKGNVEVHVYDPDALDKAVRVKSAEDPLISLDPLLQQGVHVFNVSRGYYVSGKKDFSQIARPGSDSLHQQAENISAQLNGVTASVAEDDIFSGGSVIASVSALQESGVVINKVIPGIQVGKPEQLEAMKIIVDPVVVYDTTDGKDIFDKVDLGDPRDYLTGGSGLVVKMPNGKFGRSPYILPFVSTTARASIPEELEKEFALKVLQANHDFFSHIEEKLGNPILLNQMNRDFMVMMHTMFGFDKNTPMSQTVSWAMDNIDTIWSFTQKQGELQEKLADLELPQSIIFVDVNGTLFSDNSSDGSIPKADVELLQQSVINATNKGVSVGLCSDSPLPQLLDLSERLGMTGPIAAENGNILYNNGKVLVVNPLTDRDNYRQQISTIAGELGLQASEEVVAKEFGGNLADVEIQWGFGANRIASVTVFGPPELTQRLEETFGNQEDISTDYSPEYSYYAIHSGDDYKQNKGKTLGLLAAYGHNVLMIGNSISDWVNPETGVQCAFVADSRINEDVVQQAAYISNKPLVQGVTDIINKVRI